MQTPKPNANVTIVSEGHGMNTRVLVRDSAHEIQLQGVLSVRWEVDGNHRAKAIIELLPEGLAITHAAWKEPE